ncbi:aspartic proteinase nepenthesin-1-like [Triticum dicoccoides]|uniref:aspartic proteinase nepenthesin-1-like n=1 Tax=Triticum dicoccoides TaxID=85692 RepID=UPI000E786834|nr:aspartic proteinase nepenthesin-1-like [Triticum dicoccoides]
MAVAMPAARSLLLLLLLVAPLAPGSSEAAVRPNPKIVNWVGDNARASTPDSFGALVFDLSVGTPRQTLSFVMDITEQLVWAQCGQHGFTQSQAPTFRPGSSFAPIGCKDTACQSLAPDDNCIHPDDHCNYAWDFQRHGSGSMSGYLATETFSFGAKSVPGMVFGCSDNVTARALGGVSGFAGFGRAPLSLVSQLHVSKFSYFIDDNNGDDNSFLGLGDAGAAPALGNNSTPLLLATTKQDSYLYYVNLTGIQVDGELLADIQAGAFAVKEDGSGGVFLSTTIPYTFLPEAAYQVLRQELASRIRSQGVAPMNATSDDLYFLKENFRSVKVPRLALVFDGADAAMELNVKNYFSIYDEWRTCLTILPSPNGAAVLGSLLQTGRTMTYDIHGDGGQLTFEPVAAGGPDPALAHAGGPDLAPAHAHAGAPAPARGSLVITGTLLAWVLLFQQF